MTNIQLVLFLGKLHSSSYFFCEIHNSFLKTLYFLSHFLHDFAFFLLLLLIFSAVDVHGV